MHIHKIVKLKWDKYLLLIAILFSFFVITSCTQNGVSNRNIVEKKDTLQQPLVYKNASEIITLLDTCPKPQIIYVPQNPGGSYKMKTSNGTETIHLVPPVTKPADFFLPIQHYNVEEGLPLSMVSASYCDRNGNLWFGTYGNGVSRYDGKSFTNFSLNHGLEDDQIFSIYQDKDGNMWFGTWNGIVKYNGISFKIYNYTNGLESTRFQCICQDKNDNMWFGTGYGLWKFNGKSFDSLFVKDGLPSNNIHCMLQDKSGNLWLGTDTGVSKYDGNSFKNYTIGQNLLDNNVTSLL